MPFRCLVVQVGFSRLLSSWRETEIGDYDCGQLETARVINGAPEFKGNNYADAWHCRESSGCFITMPKEREVERFLLVANMFMNRKKRSDKLLRRCPSPTDSAILRRNMDPNIPPAEVEERYYAMLDAPALLVT